MSNPKEGSTLSQYEVRRGEIPNAAKFNAMLRELSRNHIDISPHGRRPQSNDPALPIPVPYFSVQYAAAGIPVAPGAIHTVEFEELFDTAGVFDPAFPGRVRVTGSGVWFMFANVEWSGSAFAGQTNLQIAGNGEISPGAIAKTSIDLPASSSAPSLSCSGVTTVVPVFSGVGDVTIRILHNASGDRFYRAWFSGFQI